MLGILIFRPVFPVSGGSGDVSDVASSAASLSKTIYEDSGLIEIAKMK
jgi:hypothetical protein